MLPVQQLTNMPTTRAIPMANVGYHKNDNVYITINPFLGNEKEGQKSFHCHFSLCNVISAIKKKKCFRREKCGITFYYLS